MIDRGRFRPMKPAAMDSLEDITGIVDAGSNGLWLTTVTGVIHASKDEVDRALRDASYRFQWEQFGFLMAFRDRQRVSTHIQRQYKEQTAGYGSRQQKASPGLTRK